MSLFKLAYSNFKRSIKNYVSLIISLSFSIFVFFNFQNIAFSGAMDVLKDRNSDYITPDRKVKLLSAITNAWYNTIRVIYLMAPALAKDGIAKYDGVGLTLSDGF